MDHDLSTFRRLSLVLPAWNEAEIIVQAIHEADAALRAIVDHYEIIVVDDGSNDETARLVDAVSQQNPAVRLVRHEQNLGYGAALRNGFAAARYELIAFTDADCQFDLRELNRLVLLSDDYDAVCGYRIDRQDPWLRCFYSRGYNALVRTLLGIQVRDVDCALKLFRREALSETRIQTDGFLVNSDLLTQIADNGGHIVEVGVTHRPRTAGESTVSVKHIPTVFATLMRYWWNRIQFPQSGLLESGDTEAMAADATGGNRVVWAQVAVVVLFCLFMLANLSYPLIDRDETRYAEIPREMLATGDWILPSLNFQTYYDKPPMLYWLCALSYSVFGISEWAARLVPALAALGTLLATMWFANRRLGSTVGLLSGAVLCLSAGFAFASRYLLIDGVLTFFVTMSLISAYEAMNPCGERSGRVDLKWWTSAAVFCGLGFLTKGPLALVLLIPVVAAFNWLTSGVAKLRWKHYAWLLLIVGLIAGPWFAAVALRDHQFLYEFFYHHNVKRFAGDFHVRPVWYFVPVILIAGHPWSFLTVPLTIHLVSRDRKTRRNRPPVIGFAALWAGWTFVFFSLSRCKLPTYLLPAAPGFAFVVSHYLSLLGQRTTWDDKAKSVARYWSPRGAAATTCAAAIGVAIFAGVSGAISSYGMLAWLGAWLAIGSLCLIRFVQPARQGAPWMTSAVVSAVFVIMLMHHLVPAYSRTRTLFAPQNSVAKEVGFSTALPIATVAHEFSEVPFYLNRTDVKNFSLGDSLGLCQFVIDRGEALLVVDRKILLGELRQAMPPGTRMQTLAERGPARIIHATRLDAHVARLPRSH